MLCNVCKNPSEKAFNGLILNKYNISYFTCSRCGFLQTETPYWLQESYNSAISDLDLGPINRAIAGSRIVESVIAAEFNPNGKFIDWGGGYGVFTRLMRDRGYNFYWRDLHCKNIFAKHFIAEDDQNYDVMTCFEVFEHLIDPRTEIEKMLKFSENIIFTTLVSKTRIKSSTEWWYLTPEHGQHISIYSLTSLKFIANSFGLYFYSDGTGFHIFTKKPLSEFLFKRITRDRFFSKVFRCYGRFKLENKSLLMKDFQAITGWNV